MEVNWWGKWNQKEDTTNCKIQNSTNLWGVHFVHSFRCSLSPTFRTSLAINCFVYFYILFVIAVVCFAKMEKGGGGRIHPSFIYRLSSTAKLTALWLQITDCGQPISAVCFHQIIFCNFFAIFSSVFQYLYFFIKSSMHACMHNVHTGSKVWMFRSSQHKHLHTRLNGTGFCWSIWSVWFYWCAHMQTQPHSTH